MNERKPVGRRWRSGHRFVVFTEDQQERLEVHLATKFDGHANGFSDAVFAIAEAFRYASVEIRYEDALRRERTESRRHFARLVEHAAALRSSLATERPLWNTSEINWKRLDADLETLIRSASVHAESKPAKRGAPPLEWRDNLISVVFSVYPMSRAKKSDGSHFEQTVSLLLEFLGLPLSDPHKQIEQSLRRKTRGGVVIPPFRVISNP